MTVVSISNCCPVRYSVKFLRSNLVWKSEKNSDETPSKQLNLSTWAWDILLKDIFYYGYLLTIWPFANILDMLLNFGYASGVNVSNTEWEMASRFHIPVKFSYIELHTVNTLGRGMNPFSLPNSRFVLNSRTDCILQPWLVTSLSKGQHWIQQLHHIRPACYGNHSSNAWQCLTMPNKICGPKLFREDFGT